MKSVKMRKLTYNLSPLLISIIIFSVGFFLGLKLVVGTDHSSRFRKVMWKERLYKDCTFFPYNNMVSTILLLLGAFSMGSTTVTNLFANGLELGYSVRGALASGFSSEEVIMLVAPHGSFEILGFILAGSAGIRIPASIILYLLRKREQPVGPDDLRFYYRAALLSLIFIMIAACIEANVTLRIAEDILRQHAG